MSNSETLQQHNTRLNENNLDIDNIISIIEGLPNEPSGTLEINQNGEYDVKSYEKANVNIEEKEILLQNKNATPTTQEQIIIADNGYDGLSSVSISAVTSEIDGNIQANNIKSGVSILGVEGTLKEGITPTGEIAITENGTYDVTNYASANVNIESEIDNTFEDGLLDNSLTGTYTNNRVKQIYSQKLRTTNISIFNSTSVETLGSYAFYQSKTLEECNIPNLNNIGSGYTFQGCTALKGVNFPKITTLVSASTFSGCTALTYANLGTTTQLATGCFNGCTDLKALILTKTDKVVILSNVNVFSNSGIANGIGFVYVPDSLVELYKISTNWSTYANQIKPLSELPDEYKALLEVA